MLMDRGPRVAESPASIYGYFLMSQITLEKYICFNFMPIYYRKQRKHSLMLYLFKQLKTITSVALTFKTV